MNPLLIALLSGLGVSRFDSEDAALTEGGAKLAELQTDNADLKAKVDQFPEEEEMNEDQEGAEEKLKAAEAKIAALEAKLAERDKADEEREDAAQLAKLQGIAKAHSVKHDGLDLLALRVKLAKTRLDSVTAETDVAILDALIASIPAKPEGRNDGAKKWEQGNQTQATGTRADASDADGDYYDPTFARIDKQRAGATR
jgi:hypothetical protein